MEPGSFHSADVEEKVQGIAAMNKDGLRALWRSMHKSDPPKAFGPDLLRRSLAYRVQELAYGGFSSQMKRELAAAVRQVLKRPSSRIELPRRIKSGAVLIRQWKGRAIRVTVADDGFVYDAKRYSSLSEIALFITGTKWNGPRFFGLRPAAKAEPQENGKQGAAFKRPRGRPKKQLCESAGRYAKAGQ